MTTLHIANTQFESELIGVQDNHPVHQQLQYLPLLYANANDLILVNEMRDDVPKSCVTKNELPSTATVESWGPSTRIQKFAQKHGFTYDIPPIDVVKTIASKFFPYEQGYKLDGSALLTSKEDLHQWMADVEPPCVLKKPFGTAGRGHQIFKCKAALHLPFTGPVLGERWVERKEDFSTQWKIEKSGKINFLGWTLMACNQFGKYTTTHIRKTKPSFIDQHIEAVKPLLEKCASMGFFGHLGIDGFTYEGKVHAACEINPRKTMGWVALQLQERLQLEEFSMHYKRGQEGLLPSTPLGLQLTISKS